MNAGDDFEKRVRELEKGSAWDEKDEVVEVDVKRPLDKVVPVRLPADVWERLRRLAKERGVGPSTLIRMWVFENLRKRVV